MSKIDEMIAEDRIREEVIARIEALQAYVIKVTDENKRLRAAVERNREEFGRIYKALIWYEETYSRLPTSAKQAFNTISEGVEDEVEKGSL